MKVYVGQTWQTLKDRWDSGHGYKGCVYLEKAIKKYGKDAFYYEILTVCSTQETADYWETYFIDKYDSCNRKVGYNIMLGGMGHGRIPDEVRAKISKTLTGRKIPEEQVKRAAMARTGKKHSAEAKAKMSKSKIGNKNGAGRIVTEETRQKLSIANTGKPSCWKGKSLPEEHRKNISIAKTGVPKTEEHKANISKSLTGKYVGENSPSYGKRKTEEEKEISRGENNKMAKLTKEQALEIRQKYDPAKCSRNMLAKEYGVSRKAISHIINRTTWGWLK